MKGFGIGKHIVEYLEAAGVSNVWWFVCSVAGSCYGACSWWPVPFRVWRTTVDNGEWSSKCGTFWAELTAIQMISGAAGCAHRAWWCFSNIGLRFVTESLGTFVGFMHSFFKVWFLGLTLKYSVSVDGRSIRYLDLCFVHFNYIMFNSCWQSKNGFVS